MKSTRRSPNTKPAGLTEWFSERLNKTCAPVVKVAEDGERVLPGHACSAPRRHHFWSKRGGADVKAALSDTATARGAGRGLPRGLRHAARMVGQSDRSGARAVVIGESAWGCARIH